jgi:wyosine [tRNA(Phe)-imidazoG37] synthetase (radical SAM superfamily)
MEYVFGPVPSRRLGQSLGIDPVGLKVCNWNCVYCQLGRTSPLVHERREYVPRMQVLAEVETALAEHAPGEIDWVTFVGSGETCLHSGLGWMIREVKRSTSLPVAVITNGSLLSQPEVRDSLAPSDAVLPSLDAGEAGLYRKINRPHPQASFERLVQGLMDFRAGYAGNLWVEVMLLQGMNDGEHSLHRIGEVLGRIRPDAVHLLLPTRPPAEPWVRPTDEEGMMRAMAILGQVAEVVHPAEGEFDLSGSADIVDAILGVITRHPMRQDELERALASCKGPDAQRALQLLTESGRAKVIERHGARFWSPTAARFVDGAERSGGDHRSARSQGHPRVDRGSADQG